MKIRYAVAASLLAMSVAFPALADEDVQASASVSTTASNGDIRGALEQKKIDLEHERQDIKNTIKTNIENLRASTTASTTALKKDEREELNDNRKEMQEVRRDFHVELAQNKLVNAAKLFSLTIDRLQKIIDRIDSRITKIKGQGGNTTAAENLVVSAKANIADAQVQITAMNSLNLLGMSSTTAQANFMTIKTDAAKARTDLESARKSLMQAVESLAQSEKGLHGHASTTVTTTSTTTASTTTSH